ncbi:MAG: HAD hydrolase-like protein [Patescibacteria group bacterium]
MESKRCLTGIKFFVFDFDGVLVDSTKLCIERFNIILGRLGLPSVSSELLRKNRGMKLVDLIDFICLEVGATDEQKKLFQTMDSEVNAQMPYQLKREIMEALLNLRLFNCYVGLITSRTNESFMTIAAKVGLSLKIFHQIQTADHFNHHKPDGRVFNPFINWAKAYGVSPEEMVYIGDTVDADFAATQDRNPKLEFIGVVSGANTREEFLEAGVPPCRIVDFDKLPDFLHHVISEKAEA